VQIKVNLTKMYHPFLANNATRITAAKTENASNSRSYLLIRDPTRPKSLTPWPAIRRPSQPVTDGPMDRRNCCSQSLSCFA